MNTSATTHQSYRACTPWYSSYRQLPAAFYQNVAPAPASHPQTVIYNQGLADTLNLPSWSKEQISAYFSGQQQIDGSQPLAQAYAGQQFGVATMLGDGRAILLGEWLTATGQRVDIQLKGAGRTAYSRGGDGHGTLSAMLREYLISEAMAALGIATTRSLAVVKTGDKVYRQTPEDGAILTRVAQSHLRVGSFQFAAWHPDKSLLPALFAYCLERHDPDLIGSEQAPLHFLQRVMQRQIRKIVDWMRVGFIHGVMNTDNVSISGETLDYGPCAFLDAYDPAQVFSSIDTQGRYAFGNQPFIAQWNWARLAETLLPLIDADSSRALEQVQSLIPQYSDAMHHAIQDMLGKKLGLLQISADDDLLIKDWLELLQTQGLDYTNAHRALMSGATVVQNFCPAPEFIQWHQRWQARTQAHAEQSLQLMQGNNPAIIPRNHLVEQALAAAAQGDMNPFMRLHQALKTPYAALAWADLQAQLPRPEERIQQTFCGT